VANPNPAVALVQPIYSTTLVRNFITGKSSRLAAFATITVMSSVSVIVDILQTYACQQSKLTNRNLAVVPSRKGVLMSKPDLCVISKQKARDLVHSGQAKEIGPVRDKFTGIIYQSLYWKTKI
jgi:hypothetical protein